MGISVIASARDVATRHLCETIDRIARQGPVLAESPVAKRDIVELWPRFAQWIIGTPPVDTIAIPATNLSLALTMAPKVLAVIQALREKLEEAEYGLPVAEREWKAFRGNLGYRSGAYMDAFLRKQLEPREVVDRRPLVRAGIDAAESGAEIAHAMFQYTRTDGIRVYEHPASAAVVHASTAIGWWECQAEWSPSMPREPEFYWRPVMAREAEQFARRAAEALLEIAR